ncbi:hypothetical protein D3C81_654510 [compost metagenome]
MYREKDIRIEITGFEKYDIKKYTDDFKDKKKIPFKTVAFTTAHFSDGSKLNQILKFSDSKVSNEKAIKRAYNQLKEVGIIEVEEYTYYVVEADMDSAPLQSKPILALDIAINFYENWVQSEDVFNEVIYKVKETDGKIVSKEICYC